jgi:hypothetical protein
VEGVIVMERRPAMAVMALGAVVTLLGGTGIFAAFSDRAKTGTSSVESGALPHAADLQIGSYSSGTCGDFVEDLTTDLLFATDVQEGYGVSIPLCLKSVGSADVTLSMTVIDLTDSETGCTGDEGEAGDTTCGSGVGELSSALSVGVFRFDCGTGSGTTADRDWLNASTTKNFALGPLQPGEVACVAADVAYGRNVPELTQQVAQSDRATWRFAFDGATA